MFPRAIASGSHISILCMHSVLVRAIINLSVELFGGCTMACSKFRAGSSAPVKFIYFSQFAAGTNTAQAPVTLPVIELSSGMGTSAWWL